MGFLHAKCPDCWDPLPCSCPIPQPQPPTSTRTDELLTEQNRLLRELVARTPRAPQE